MHIIWENVIKGLLDIWTGKYKGLSFDDSDDFVLDQTVLSVISEACLGSGSTIPASFGCRVPDPFEQRHYFSAEAWGLWGMVVGPVVLRQRFNDPQYYDHFLKLIRLINICLLPEITSTQVDELEAGFAQWVQTFEE